MIVAALLASASFAQAAPTWPASVAKMLPAPAAQAGPLASGVSGYAVVRGIDAKLMRGSNVLSTLHLSPGIFAVEFNSNVSKCAYAVTLGDPEIHQSGPPALGFVSVVGTGATGNKQGVLVRTADTTGAAADISFYLTVTC